MKKIATLVFAVMAFSIVLVGCKGEEATTPDAGATKTAPSGTETPKDTQ